MIAETFKKVGLEINVQNTKILRKNAKSQKPIFSGDEILEDVPCLEVNLMKLEAISRCQI